MCSIDQGVVLSYVPIKIRKARTANGYSRGSNIVASKVDFVDGQPGARSVFELPTDSIPSPQLAMLANEFGEVHPILSCLKGPMASSPFLALSRCLATEIWR